jgi:hypothetical protein
MSRLFELVQSPVSDISLDNALVPVIPELAPLYNISLFIPRVFINIREQRIVKIFHILRIGKVSKIDFVWKRGRNGKPYNSVFVHFDHWYDNTASRNFQARVRDPAQDALLVYDDPWYWVVLENTSSDMTEVDSWEQYNEW